MRVMVLGATGNLGTAVVDRLARDRTVTEVIGVARRPPGPGADPSRRVTWRCADVRRSDWRCLLEGVDAVVHAAWMIQPTRRPEVTWETNVTALAGLLEALPHTSVNHLIVASSIAAYSPSPTPVPRDESWPTHGASAAAYAREKAYLERLLEAAQGRGADLAWVRPAFVLQRRAASEQRRIFGGRLAPRSLARPGRLPVLPLPSGLRLQVVHAADVADAVARILQLRAVGPFNLCAEDVLWSEQLGELLGARPVQLPGRVVRSAMTAGWAAHLVPSPPELLDALLRVPVMSAARARQELGWAPHHDAASVVSELLHGVADAAGHDTPPLGAD
jgi:nucleoside-diphosphate-sugar epimerase